LDKHYSAALVKYAELVGTPTKMQTVRDVVWAYIEHGRTRKQKPLAEATLANYRASAPNICAVFGAMDIAEVTQPMVYKYLTTAGNVQANRDKALLSAAYTHACNLGLLAREKDPTKGLQYRNPEPPRKRYMEDAEVERLILAASPKLACIVRFIELTAMRQSDALRVRMSDIDDEGVHYQQGKGGTRLVLVWSDELKEVVEDALRLWRRFGREYLFESHPKGKHAARGIGPYTPSGLRALWRVARLKAGLVDVRLHDLRAKAGSDAQDDSEAQRLLGHADGKVTRRHYRRKADRVKPAR
jgi:integrase